MGPCCQKVNPRAAQAQKLAAQNTLRKQGEGQAEAEGDQAKAQGQAGSAPQTQTNIFGQPIQGAYNLQGDRDAQLLGPMQGAGSKVARAYTDSQQQQVGQPRGGGAQGSHAGWQQDGGIAGQHLVEGRQSPASFGRPVDAPEAGVVDGNLGAGLPDFAVQSHGQMQRPGAVPSELSPPVNVKTVEPRSLTTQQALEELFLAACAMNRPDLIRACLLVNYSPERNTVVSMLNFNHQFQQKLPYIGDAMHLRLGSLRDQQNPPFSLRIRGKLFRDIDSWNPLLLMVAHNCQEPLEYFCLTRTTEYLHLASLFSKPYPREKQKTLVMSQEKYNKVECFALKLAILNQNGQMLRFLFNGKPVNQEKRNEQLEAPQDVCQISQVWNVAHVLWCMRYIIKYDWQNGLGVLLSLRRVKQLLSSVSEAYSFLELIEKLLDLIDSIPQQSKVKRMHELMTALNQPPYLTVRTCLALFLQGKYSKDILKTINSKLNMDSTPFFSEELEYIFSTLDPQSCNSEVLDAFMAKYHQEVDEQKIRQTHEQMLLDAKQFQIVQDDNQVEDFIEHLDVLGQFFWKTQGQVRFTRDSLNSQPGLNEDNVAILILKSGMPQLVDFLYCDYSDCNLKSLLFQRSIDLRATDQLLEPNRFEIATARPELDVSVFAHLYQQHTSQESRGTPFFSLVFQYLVDQMALKNILGLLNLVAHSDQGGISKSLDTMSAILSNKKVHSLFNGSLEAQKYAFAEGLHELVTNQEIFNKSYMEAKDVRKLKELLKCLPVLQEYVDAVKSGLDWSEFLEKTQEYYLERQAHGRETRTNRFKWQVTHQWRPWYPDTDEFEAVEAARAHDQPLNANQRRSLASPPAKDPRHTLDSSIRDSFGHQDAHPFSQQVLAAKQSPPLKPDKDSIDMSDLVQQVSLQERDHLANIKQVPDKENKLLQKPASLLPERQAPTTSEAGNSRLGDKYLADHAENVIIDEEEIQMQFNDLEKYQVHGEISIAYQELIGVVRSGEAAGAELHEQHQEVVALYRLNPFEHIQCCREEGDGEDADEETLEWLKGKSLWNMLLVGLACDNTSFVQDLLTNDFYKHQLDPLALKKPPRNNQTYHIMEASNNSPATNTFAFELVVQSRNSELLQLLLSTFSQYLTMPDLAHIFKQLYRDLLKPGSDGLWLDGVFTLLLSPATKLMARHLQAQDKEVFFAESVVEPVRQAALARGASQAVKKMLNKVLAEVLGLLKEEPFYRYCLPRFIGLFHEFNLVDAASLAKIDQEDVCDFISAREANAEELKSFIQVRGKSSQMGNLKQLLQKATQMQLQVGQMAPLSPLTYIQFIRNGDPDGLTKYHLSQGQPPLHKFAGYQITQAQQTHQLSYLPQDEIIQMLLFDLSGYKRQGADNASVDTIEEHKQLFEYCSGQVIETAQWNPVIFAIYYGNRRAVDYFLRQDKAQHFYYLLSYPFSSAIEKDQEKKDDEDAAPDGSEDQFEQERAELFPLILCLVTQNHEMFSHLWNLPMLWNKDIYLIILGNFVFETENINLIKAFLLAEKTKRLFNFISLAEKQKFIQFVIKSLEHQIVGDSEVDLEDDNSELEEYRLQLEDVLNSEMLAKPPYSLVNLTENLIPLNINSTGANLVQIMEQYRASEESHQLLAQTISNLRSSQDPAAGRSQWILVNSNQIWAKKLRSLIEELEVTEDDLFARYPLLQDIYENLLVENIIFDNS